MTEEQKQLTLGQISDMKTELETNIKNMVKDFVDKTGAKIVNVSGNFETYAEIDRDTETITNRTNESLYVTVRLFN